MIGVEVRPKEPTKLKTVFDEKAYVDRLEEAIRVLMPAAEKDLMQASPVGVTRTLKGAWKATGVRRFKGQPIMVADRNGVNHTTGPDTVVGRIENLTAYGSHLVNRRGPWKKNPGFFLIPWVRKFIGGTDKQISRIAYAIGVTKMRSTKLPDPFMQKAVDAFMPKLTATRIAFFMLRRKP